MQWTEKLQEVPIIRIVGEVADRMGLETYVVGGYVRDLYLSRENKDIDFVCVGSGIELAQEVAKHIGGDMPVHVFKNFGTAMIKYEGEEIEFVGARKESYNFESRKPTVEEGSLEDDQRRRDFTINALALCINKNRWAELIDSFDGVADIKKKIIRTPLDPEITFSDDPLRMLRAIRFATQLGFDIAPDTLKRFRKINID